MISFKLLVFAALVAVTLSNHLHHHGGLLHARVLGNHHHEVHSSKEGLVKIGGSVLEDREEGEGSGVEYHSGSDRDSGEEQHLSRKRVVISSRGDSGNGNDEVAGKAARVRVNGFGNLKRKALYSIGFLGQGIREDHRASSIFKQLSTRSKASSVEDVLDVYLTGAFGAGEIIDSWVPGLGKLFSSVALASAKINFCLGGSTVRSSRPGTICSHKYDSNWGFKTERETSFNSAKDYITAYGLDDGLVKFRKLLSTHAKVELSSLSGSQRIVAQAIFDLFQNGRFSNNYSWSKKDVTFVFSRVITVLAALGSSYHRNVGPIIIDDLCDYTSEIGNDNNGLKLFELKDELRKAIANANSNRWRNVIRKCSDDDYHNIAREQDGDDDDSSDIDIKKNDKKRKHDDNENVDIDDANIDTKNRGSDDDNDDSDDRDGSQPDSPRKTTSKETDTQKTNNKKKLKQKLLSSFIIFSRGIKGDHTASTIFRKLSKKPKPSKVGDVLDVYLTGAFGAGTIIDSWAPGLGKLFSSLAIVSTKINYCSSNAVYKVPSTHLGSICTDKYGSQWGFKPTRHITTSSKPRDFITAYGLDDSLTKFRTLLKTHVKADLSNLSGSQKIVAQAIYDILQNGRFNPDYSWSKKDVSFVFSKVVTVLAALGSSYHKNVGITIVDNLLDYSSDIGTDSNGLVLISLKKEIKEAIVSANSHRWQQVIKECSDEQYNKHVKNQDEGDDDDDNDDGSDDSPRGQSNNANDKKNDDSNSKNNKNSKDQKDKNNDNNDVKNNKDSKKPNKDDKTGPNKDSPKDDDDYDDSSRGQSNANDKKNDDSNSENNKNSKDQKDKNNDNNDVKNNKDSKKPNKDDKTGPNKDSPKDDDDYDDSSRGQSNANDKKNDDSNSENNKNSKDQKDKNNDNNDVKNNKDSKKPNKDDKTGPNKDSPKDDDDYDDSPRGQSNANDKKNDDSNSKNNKNSKDQKDKNNDNNDVKNNKDSKKPNKDDKTGPNKDSPKDNDDYDDSPRGQSNANDKKNDDSNSKNNKNSKDQKDKNNDNNDVKNNKDSKKQNKDDKTGPKKDSPKDNDDYDDSPRGQINANDKKNDDSNSKNNKNSKDQKDKNNDNNDVKNNKDSKKPNKDDKTGPNKDSPKDDDDYDDSPRGQSNANDKKNDDSNSENNKNSKDQKDKNNDNNDVKNNKDSKKPKKDDKTGPNKDSPKDNDDDDDVDVKNNKNIDVKNDNNKKNKDDQDETSKSSPVDKNITDKKSRPKDNKQPDNKGKQKPLNSFRIFWQGIKKDHSAYSIFRSLSKKSKPTNVGDVLDVYLTGAFGAGAIIDSWAPGLGKLFSSLAIVSTKINYCSNNGLFKVPSSHLGSICTAKYGSNWGFKPDREVPASNKPRDYIIAYGLDDSLAKFRTLLKTHVKVDLSKLTGSQKIVAQAIYDILQNGRFNPDYTWSKKDVSLVFSKVITILATLGSSYHKNVGPTIIENLCDYSTDIGNDWNGLDLISLKNQIKEAIVSANSNRWQQVIKECSDEQYIKHVEKQDDDDDDDNDDKRNVNNNKRDDNPNLENTKNNKDDNDKEVKKDGKNKNDTIKENKGDKKGNNEDSLKNDDNDDDEDLTSGNKNKNKDDKNKNKDVQKDDKKDGNNNLQNENDKKDSKKDSPRNDNDKADDKKKDIKDDKKDGNKQYNNDKDDTNKNSPVGKDTTDKKPENNKPTGKKGKRKPLFSLSIFLKGIKKDHGAFSIFKNLSKKPKPTNLGDVLDVYLTGAFGAGTIIDSWAPGLGKLFSSLAIVSAKINYCSSNAPFKVPSSHLGSICTDKYGSNWGFKPDRDVSASNKPRDYIIAYGLDDGLAKFRTLLKTHVKADLSSLSGSQRIVGQAIYDILQNGRFNADYSWSKKDVSFIFSKVITVLAALGSSYHKNLGPTIVENLFDYNSEIGKDSNGLDLISLKKDIKEAIVSANSNRWQQVIKECSDDQYIQYVKKQDNNDDDDDDDDSEYPSPGQSGNNEKEKNIKDDINKTKDVKNDDRKDIKKNNKKDGKDSDKKNQDGKVNTGTDSPRNDKNNDKAGVDSTSRNNKNNAKDVKDDELNNKQKKNDNKGIKKDSSRNDDDDDDDNNGDDNTSEDKEQNKTDKKNNFKKDKIKDSNENYENNDRNGAVKNNKKDTDKQKNDDKKDTFRNDDDDNDDGDVYTLENKKKNKTDKKNNDKKEDIKDKKQDVDSGRNVEVIKDKDTNKQNKDNKKGTNKDSPVDKDTTGKKDKPEINKKPESKEKPDSKTTKDNQSALTSFGIFWQRIKGGHHASAIFKTLATKPKSTKVADVLDVYLTGTFGAGAIIDSWVPGLGKLFSSLVLASTKINYCLKNSAFRSLSNTLGSICSDKYGSNWGFKVESEVSSYEEASDYITAYGLEDGLVTFKRLLKTHTKSDLSALVGSQKVVAQAINDLFEDDRFSSDYSWTEKDVSFVFSKVITVLGALGSSYNPKFGPSLVDELLDYSSEIGDNSNGLVLIDLRQKIKKSIATCQSHSWNNVIIFSSADNRPDGATKEKPKTKEANPNKKDLNEDNNNDDTGSNRGKEDNKKGNDNQSQVASDNDDEEIVQNSNDANEDTNKNIEEQKNKNSKTKPGNHRTTSGRERSIDSSDNKESQNEQVSSTKARDASESDFRGSESSENSASDDKSRKQTHDFKESHHSQADSDSQTGSSYSKSYKNNGSEGTASGTKGHHQDSHSKDEGFESGTWNQDGTKTYEKRKSKAEAFNEGTFQEEQKSVKNKDGSSYEESSSSQSSNFSSSSSSSSEYKSYN